MNRFAAAKTELQKLLGPKIGIGTTDPKSPNGILMPREEPAVARAIDCRKAEFTAGRTAARIAMAEIDHPPTGIPMANDRSPIWPSGLMGSITHCDRLCVAIAAPIGIWQGVGIDIEPTTPMDPRLERFIFTPYERSMLSAQPSEWRGYLAKEGFCAKEGVYKALYPSMKKVLGFQAVEIDLPIRGSSAGTLYIDGQKNRLEVELGSAEVDNCIFVCAKLFGMPSALVRRTGLAS